jgi:hypothetical protein
MTIEKTAKHFLPYAKLQFSRESVAHFFGCFSLSQRPGQPPTLPMQAPRINFRLRLSKVYTAPYNAEWSFTNGTVINIPVHS